MALLPGDRVEHGGHHEESAEAETVHPGRNGLPAVVRQEVEVGAAEDAGDDPELEAEGGGRGRPPAAQGPGCAAPSLDSRPAPSAAAMGLP